MAMPQRDDMIETFLSKYSLLKKEERAWILTSSRMI